MTFFNRTDAGRQLADTLRAHALVTPIVVGLWRGGVPVAAEIARILNAPFEICIARKLLAPGTPPITVGAVAEGGARYLDEACLSTLGLPRHELELTTAREVAEISRLSGLLRDRPALELLNRDVILVDDGLLTGGTIRAVVRSLEMRGVRAIELALPVANSGALEAIRPTVDRVVCLISDPMLVAIGARYERFGPVSEAEVAALLAASRRPQPGPAESPGRT